MEEYKSNSYKSREEQQTGIVTTSNSKKVEKVISGTAKPKKKGEFRKFIDFFISEDISNVKSYIFLDVLRPAIKKAISDVVTNGIDMILYGETGRSKKNTVTSRVSYGGYYNKNDDQRDRDTRRSKGVFDYDNIIFETREDAKAVLNAMDDIIKQYKVVSVADLYDLANIQTDNFAINKYGWDDIHSAQVIHVRDGYMLDLPKALPLD